MEQETSLTSKGTHKESQKPISEQNLLTGFQSWYWDVVQKMESKTQVILQILHVKKSADWLKEFWGENSHITYTNHLNYLEWLNQLAVTMHA